MRKFKCRVGFTNKLTSLERGKLERFLEWFSRNAYAVPDELDLEKAEEFASQCRELLQELTFNLEQFHKVKREETRHSNEETQRQLDLQYQHGVEMQTEAIKQVEELVDFAHGVELFLKTLGPDVEGLVANFIGEDSEGWHDISTNRKASEVYTRLKELNGGRERRIPTSG